MERLVDISRVHPEPEEDREAQEYAAKFIEAGRVTHVAFYDPRKRWLYYHELDNLPEKMAGREALRRCIESVLGNDKLTGRTVLACHVVPDYELLWNIYTYGNEADGTPYMQRREEPFRKWYAPQLHLLTEDVPHG